MRIVLLLYSPRFLARNQVEKALPGLNGKGSLTLGELGGKDINQILKRSLILSRQKRPPQRLRGKTVTMIFQKPSTRTRASFETAVSDLGGHALNLSWNEMQLGRGETISDTAKVLDRYVDAIMARVFSHSDLEQLAEEAEAPVINGLSDSYHPIQTVADLHTLLQYRRKLKGLTLAYVGDE